jgi:hypothetical protein
MAAWTSDRQAEVRRLILAGFSHAQIAERLDLSRDTVSGGIRRYALTPGATVPDKRPRKEAADLWTEARLTQPWGAR